MLNQYVFFRTLAVCLKDTRVHLDRGHFDTANPHVAKT